MSDGKIAGGGREHHLDAVRALLMLFGIPFHSAHPFRADGQSWIAVSQDHSAFLTAAINFMHLFRMQGFFIIAGYFTAMLLARRDVGVYLRSRMVRLGVPLVAGLILLVPVQNFLSLLLRMPLDNAASAWMSHLFGPFRETTSHLWFLLVLIYFTFLSAALVVALPALRDMRIFERQGQFIAKWFVPIVVIGCVGIGAYETIGLRTIKILPDVVKNPLCVNFAIIYAPYFAIGLLLHRCMAASRSFNTLSWPLALIGVAAGLLFVAFDWSEKITNVLAALAAIGMTHAIVATSFKVFRRERPIISEFVNGSLVIYLFHMLVIVALFWIIETMNVPTGVKFVTLSVLTLAISFMIWRFVKRVPVLNLIFGGIGLSRVNPPVERRLSTG